MFTRRRPPRPLIALAAALLATSGCGPEPKTPPLVENGVDVRVIVEGAGRINLGPEVTCTNECVWSVPADRPVTITASGSGASVFVGWHGVCDVFPQSCERVFEDGDVAVATFAPHALRFRLIGDGEGLFRVTIAGVDTLCDEPCGIGLSDPLLVAITYEPLGTSGTTLGNWGGACADAILPNYCLVQVTGATDVSKRWFHPPVAHDDTFTMDTGASLEISAPGVLENDTDTPGDVLIAEPVAGRGVAHGSLTLRPDGGFTYTPDDGFEGTDRFVYRARDAFGNRSNVATVTILVRAPDGISVP